MTKESIIVTVFILWCTLMALILAATRYENSDFHKSLILRRY